jgi:hypothetical protein
VRHSTFARIRNGTIESKHKWVIIGGEENDRCGCGVGVVHGGIPHGRACPLAGGDHGGGSQYPWPKDGGWVLELWPRWPVEAVVANMQLEGAVAATMKASRLLETLPTTSRVLNPYENPVTWKFDS